MSLQVFFVFSPFVYAASVFGRPLCKYQKLLYFANLYLTNVS